MRLPLDRAAQQKKWRIVAIVSIVCSWTGTISTKTQYLFTAGCDKKQIVIEPPLLSKNPTIKSTKHSFI